MLWFVVARLDVSFKDRGSVLVVSVLCRCLPLTFRNKIESMIVEIEGNHENDRMQW